MLTDGQARDSLRQGVAEVGVLRVAAVGGPPPGVDGELHQVGEPPDLLRAGRLTAGQGAELVQVDGVRAVFSRKALMKVKWLNSSSVLSWMYWFMSSSSTATASV